jgi:S-methylmethionine-dependent homocysteine/selenocysteine methylase
VISFTLETDGRLPSGERLQDAVERVDAESDRSPAFFMVNCAHPSHFASVLAGPGEWKRRVGGVRANASRRSHQELDEADELDAGNPAELALEYVDLKQVLPEVRVVGGCCGTDTRHIAGICEHWLADAGTH